MVEGGACEPDSDGNLQVIVRNTTAYPQKMVAYVTGGRSSGLAKVQVRRGSGAAGDVAGHLAGAVGLRREQHLVVAGGSLSLTIDAGMADDDGRILLLAYDCALGDASDCPAATSAGDPVNFAVQRRPLFQVLVGYDLVVIQRSGLAICKGDDCQRSYPLGRYALPDSAGCGISAFGSGGGVHWPRGIIAGGDCDVDTLTEVPVEFRVPSGGGTQRLRIYATGRRVPQLDEVSVWRDEQASMDAALPYYADPAYRGFAGDAVVCRRWYAGFWWQRQHCQPYGFAGRCTIRSNMRWVLIRHPALYNKMGAKAWVTDGLNAVEKRLLDSLLYLAVEQPQNPGVALGVVDMSFMGGSSVDALDYITVMALFGALDDGRLTAVLRVAGNDGISEAERRKVIYASVMRDNSDIGLVTDSYFAVNHVSGPTSAVPITELRPAAAAFDNTASINRAVGYLKSKMGSPFPIDHVVAVADSKALLPNSAGVNYGGNVISYNPAPEGEQAGDRVKSTIIHEVAHYYWRGGEVWVVEGMASAIEKLGAGAFAPALPDSVTLNVKGGCTHRALRDLVEAAPQLGDPQFYCNYYLGQRLFLELHDSLGAEEFWVGARSLHSAIVDCRAAGRDDCGRIADVRNAFPESAHVIDRHWHGGVQVPTVGGEADAVLGRMGVYEAYMSVSSDGVAQVLVNPDMADEKGHVWLFGYRCDGADDYSCPRVARPAVNGYDLEVGPDFAVLVRFTSESGLAAADLKEVCRGQQCDIAHPWLRRAEPSVSECSVQLGAHWDFWPDRVVRGGGCYFRGAHYGLVDFGAEGEEKFVVYTTGGVRSGLELVPVYGLLGKDDNAEEEQLGRSGLRETRVELAPGGKEQVWVRSDMADDDGNVWLFVYRCLTTYGDDGCPLVGRDAIRPSYDVPIRPAFVVRVGFLSTADRDQSSFVVVCPPDSGSCRLTAIFRDSEGNSLPGTVEFRVDRGSLGEAGSTVASSQRGHTRAGDGEYKFEETLHLPASGGVVNIQAELLGDGLILRKQAGSAGAVDRISVRVMRCSGDGDSCHDDGLEEVDDLLAGDHFVLGVTGYDAAGARVFDTGRVSDTYCANGPTGPGAEFRLKSRHLKSHVYGVATQPDDRGYTGCAIRVSDDAPSGTYSISVSYGSMTVQAQILVVVDTSGFGFLGLTGPAQLKSGESREYTVRGYTLSGEASPFDGGCLELSLTGALESAESGSGTDGCLAEELPEGGFKFTVKAQEGVIYSTDSSVGVTYEGRTKVKHVLVVPAEDEAAPPPVAPSSSRITDLTITPEGPQLRVSWTGSPTADFESLRAQVWLVIGGEDVFLPGCMGGEPHDVSTYEAFCMLSYGQSGDVYHAAVGFLRHDGTAVPVETAQWVRP